MTAVAKLNIFQKLVRRWDAVHPYNAAQVLKIAGHANPVQLRNAWHDGLAVLGLGRAQIDGNHFHFEHLNGDTPPDVVRQSNSPLSDFLSQELNRPFEDPNEIPFRPFVIHEADAHYLGVVYHHWIADSASIRLLLREWFVRLHHPSRARTRPLKLADGGYWKLFGPSQSNWRLDEGLLSSARWSARFKRVRRIEQNNSDFAVRFSLHETQPGLICRLQEKSRQMGVKVHDVFLAAIAQACDRHVPLGPVARRQDLALGTIVDLRPYSPVDLSDTFGLFLGFTSVICRPDDLRDWPRLLQTIADQSRVHKQSGVPQASSIRMLVGLAAERMLTREKLVTFYRKRVPLAGGISNVNLNQTWAKEYHPHPLLDYIRVSPTGPMMPLVFTTSTLGDRFNVGLTCRRSIVPDDVAQQIASMFMNRLIEFAA
jgi:hypothetical protein